MLAMPIEHLNYLEAIKFVESFPNLDQPLMAECIEPNMTPQEMRVVLNKLGNPERGRGTVHITGSKGKGSTASLIASGLNAQDQLSALFTCPHIISYLERMSIGGELIKETEFSAGIEKIKEQIKAMHKESEPPIALFYVLIALFFSILKEHNPEIRWQVLEVGLGGKNDPTNIFDQKDLAVITPIHREHIKFLGETVVEITENKAGIITPGCQVVVAPQQNDVVVEILKSRAEESGCQFVYVPDHYHCRNLEKSEGGQKLTIEGPWGIEEFSTSMIGKHQIVNTMTALAAIDCLAKKSFTRQPDLISAGFTAAKLKGRLEVLGHKPLVIADGAHTPESAQLLTDTIDEYFNYEQKILVLATGRDKLASGLVKALVKNTDKVIVTNSRNAKAMPIEELAEVVSQNFSGEVLMIDGVLAALDKAKSMAGESDLVLVSGSLFAAGEAAATTF